MKHLRIMLAAAVVGLIIIAAFGFSALAVLVAPETSTSSGGSQVTTSTITTQMPPTTTGGVKTVTVGNFSGTISYPTPPTGDIYLTLLNNQTVYDLQDLPLLHIPGPTTVVTLGGSVFTNPYSHDGHLTMRVTSVSYTTTFSGTFYYVPRVVSGSADSYQLITNATCPKNYCEPYATTWPLDFSMAGSGPSQSNSTLGMTVMGTVNGEWGQTNNDTIHVQCWSFNSSATSYSLRLVPEPANFSGTLEYSPTLGFSAINQPVCASGTICPLPVGPTYWLNFSNASSSPAPSDVGKEIRGTGILWGVLVGNEQLFVSTVIEVQTWAFV